MEQTDFWVLAAYLAAMIALGVYYTRRNTNLAQMFAAGHQSPWWVAGLSSFMTMFSAGTFVVWGGLAYRLGLVALVINLAYGVSALLAGYLVAGRWQKMGISSPAEFVRLRFGELSLQTYLWLMMVFRVIGAAISLYALAVLVSALIPLQPGNIFADPESGRLSLISATLLFGAVIVLYTLLGGFWAVLMTDVMQFVVLNLAVVITVALMVPAVGGWGGFVASVPEGFFSPTSEGYGWWFIAGWVAVHFFMIGGEWAFAQRFISVPSPADARKSAYLFGGLYLVSPLLWLAPPLLYRSINPSANPEEAYILAAQSVLPAGMLGLVIAAMFSATASLISGQLNVFAGALTTLAVRLKDGAGRATSGRGEVFIGRVATLLLGAFLITIAILIPRFGGAEKVIVQATSLMVGPLVAPTIWGLLGRRVDQRAVITTLVISGIFAAFLFAIEAPALAGIDGLQPLRAWIAGNGNTASLVVGALVPAAVLTLFHLLARHDAKGAARIDRLIGAANGAREKVEPLPHSDAFAVVAITLFGSAVLVIGLAIVSEPVDRIVLLIFGGLLMVIAAAFQLKFSPRTLSVLIRRGHRFSATNATNTNKE